jgi:hypothetical protein
MSIGETATKMFHILSEVFVLLFLASPIFFLIVRICFPFQGRTQNAQAPSDPEKRRSDALTALVSHKVTRYDLQQIDKENDPRYTEWLEAGIITKDAEAQSSGENAENTSMDECCNDDGSSPLRRLSLHNFNECINDTHGIGATTVCDDPIPAEPESWKENSRDQISHWFMTCAICLSDYVEGDTVCWSKHISCRHVFHQHCLLPWLEAHDTCPNCRWNLFTNKDTSNSSSLLPLGFSQ